MYMYSEVLAGGRWEKYEMRSFLVTVETTPLLDVIALLQDVASAGRPYWPLNIPCNAENL